MTLSQTKATLSAGTGKQKLSEDLELLRICVEGAVSSCPLKWIAESARVSIAARARELCRSAYRHSTASLCLSRFATPAGLRSHLPGTRLLLYRPVTASVSGQTSEFARSFLRAACKGVCRGQPFVVSICVLLTRLGGRAANFQPVSLVPRRHCPLSAWPAAAPTGPQPAATTRCCHQLYRCQRSLINSTLALQASHSFRYWANFGVC